MKVTIKNLSNKPVGEMELPETVFGYPYNEHLSTWRWKRCAPRPAVAPTRRRTART